MTISTTKTEPQAITPSTLGKPVGSLALRFLGSSRAGQEVRLDGGKYSIGSGKNCNLRLEAEGIRPVHCLILRGPRGTVVRRWSPDTRLNGKTFRDALLAGGDRLSIGSLEFEILADDMQTEPAAAMKGDSRLTKLTARLKDLSDQLRRQSSQYEFDSQAWAKERNELNAALQTATIAERQAADNLARLEDALQDQQRQSQQREAELLGEHEALVAQIEQSHGEQADRAAALGEARDQLAAERKTLAAQAVAHQAEHEAAQQQWDEMKAALREAHETFEQERTQWRQRVSDRQTELAELERALADTRSQLVAQTHELDRARSELEEERSAYFHGREQTAHQLEEREAELSHREEALSDQKRLLRIREAELEELHAAVSEKQVALDQEVAQLHNDRKELLAWRGECEAEFSQRRSDLQAQQQQLESAAASLEQQRNELAQRAAQLAEETASSANDVEQQRAKLEQEREQLRAELTDAARLRTEVEAARNELERHTQQLEEQRTAVAQREQALAEQQSNLSQGTDDRRTQLQKESAALAELEKELRKREAACDERDMELQRLLHEAAEKEQEIASRQHVVNAAQLAHEGEVAEAAARLKYQQDVIDYRMAELDELRRQRSTLHQTAERALQQRLSKIAEKESELAERETALATVVDDRQQQVAEAEIAQQAERLESLQAELTRREDEFAQARDGWSEHRQALEDELSQLRAAAEQQGQLIAELQQAMMSEPQATRSPPPAAATVAEVVEVEDSDSDQPPLERSAALDAVPFELLQSASAHDDDAVIQSLSEPADDDNNESDDTQPPSEGMLALERLRAQMLECEDEEEEFGSEASSGDLGGYDASDSFGDIASSDSLGHEDTADTQTLDDISIEDYMNQLMQRVQGHSEEEDQRRATASKTAHSQPRKPKPAPAKKSLQDTDNEPHAQPAAKPEKLTELSARAPAPEQASNLRAMRELANESARSAITTSTQVSAVRAVRGKFAIAAAAGVTAVAILTLSNGIVSLATGVSLGCFAAAGWFGYDGFRSRRRLQAQSANDCAGSTTDDHN